METEQRQPFFKSTLRMCLPPWIQSGIKCCRYEGTGRVLLAKFHVKVKGKDPELRKGMQPSQIRTFEFQYITF